ncbi:hypothetical protein M2322_004664 [Rhodoblastus acidophilus]|nr:hypothetical protein [Rhodoblastus acidophilus]
MGRLALPRPLSYYVVFISFSDLFHFFVVLELTYPGRFFYKPDIDGVAAGHWRRTLTRLL